MEAWRLEATDLERRTPPCLSSDALHDVRALASITNERRASRPLDTRFGWAAQRQGRSRRYTMRPETEKRSARTHACAFSTIAHLHSMSLRKTEDTLKQNTPELVTSTIPVIAFDIGFIFLSRVGTRIRAWLTVFIKAAPACGK